MVVTSLRREVASLKTQAGGGGRGPGGCDYCDGRGPDDHDPDEPYIIYFDDELPDDLEETCPRCGRELITPIYFDDDPRAPWNIQ